MSYAPGGVSVPGPVSPAPVSFCEDDSCAAGAPELPCACAGVEPSPPVPGFALELVGVASD